MSSREGVHSNDHGMLKMPDGKPFAIAFSKEHPSESRAHGFDDDLLVPFAEKLGCISYKNLFFTPEKYGIDVPCPKAPLFSDCNILFDDVYNPSSENHEIYKAFVEWWTDVLSRTILSGTLQGGVHFNLAGYDKGRVQVLSQRYQGLLKNPDLTREISYGFIDKKYIVVPHVHFNKKWTNEEKEQMQAEDKYPGFTDWDLAFLLNDPRVLSKTVFYEAPSVKHLQDIKPLSDDYLASKFNIIRPTTP